MKAIAFAMGLLLVCGVCSAKAPGLVRDKELSVGGVYLNMTETAVLKRLGSPLRRTDTGEGIQLEYEGLTAWVGYVQNAGRGKRRVFKVLSTSKLYCTPSGVCLGMASKIARDKYGRAVIAQREHGRFAEYSSSESSCWLQFYVSHNFIQSVGAVCQP